MPIDWDIQTFDELPSTQDVCKARAFEGGDEGLLIQTLHQTQGRGRHGRSWAGSDQNLAVSFILKPECDVKCVGQISILIGVALAEAIGNDAQVKWPNDVLLDGQKCAGILIDSDLDGAQINWLVVGVGVNTAEAPGIGGALHTDRQAFLMMLLEKISALYTDWQARGFDDIRQKWLNCAYPKGTPLNVGIFEDLDEYGNLIVRDGTNALKTISAGDVFIKDQNYAAGD